MPFTIDLLDDSTRPKAPKIEGTTPQQRRHGRRLALIHGMHLEQMAEVREVLDLIDAGEDAYAVLAETASSLEMTRNYRLFGNLCGQECQALTFHHTAEDQMLFPPLMRGSDGLRKVVERLAAEHLIIHEMLVHFEAGAIAAYETPGEESFRQLKDVFDVLERFVKSHFGYEQQELEEAIGYHNIAM
jgi:hypothetical protein